MATGGVTLDKVIIEIEGNSQNATKGMGKLVSALIQLKSATKGGFGHLKNLSDSLEKLSTVSEKMPNIGKNLSGLSALATTLQPLSEIKNATGLKNTIETLQKLPEALGKFDAKTLENVARVSNSLSDALSPLANKLSQISQGFSAISQLADRYGISVTKVRDNTKQATSITNKLKSAISGLASPLKKIVTTSNDMGNRLTRNLDKLSSKIKQIGLSLLGTRTIFTMTRKAVSEYMSMDEELSKSITNLWRALGAQLAPAIEGVMYLFKQFVRVIYSIVLALTGIDLISRANQKAMLGWGKAAKDTLGNLQKFDDLNVVEFPSNSSSGNDNSLIDLTTIDLTPIQKIIDWVKKMRDTIKEALDTGVWYNVGKVFADGINEGISFLLKNIDIVRNKLSTIAYNFADTLNGAIDNLNFGDIGKFLGESVKIAFDSINTFFSTLHFDVIGKGISDAIINADLPGVFTGIMNTISSLLLGVFTAFVNMDWGQIANEIYNSIHNVFTNISDILKDVPWNEIGTKVHDAILNINWAQLLADILSIIINGLSGIGNTILGVFGVKTQSIISDEDLSKMTDAEKEMAEIQNKTNETKNLFSGLGAVIATVFGVVILKKFFGFLSGKIGSLFGSGNTLKDSKNATSSTKEMFDSFGKAAEIIAVLGGIALVLTSIGYLLKSFSESSISATDAVIVLGTAFLGLAVAFTAIAAASETLNGGSAAAALAILAGMALVFTSLSLVISALGKSSASTGEILAVLLTTFVGLAAIMGIVAALGPELAIGMVPFLAIVGGIVALLLTMSLTIPIILDAVGTFVERMAPVVIEILETIGNIIERIIYALGRTLPPIINSVGNVFNTIFNGVSNVINTLGNTMERILKSVESLVTTVLSSTLNFIERLGPAIETFVDSAIRSVTRLINFIVSGIEYTINTLIIDSINGLLRGLNKIPGVDFDVIQDVKIRRFEPKLATGTNEIEYEGTYYLHKGEAVVPKKYNPALGGGTNEETNQKLDTLISIMENMEFTNIVNVGNEKLYEKQQSFNKKQQNKYGTINLY